MAVNLSARSCFADHVLFLQSSHIPLLQVEKPFDTPVARATQGERTLTRLVSFKKSVRAEPVEA